MRKSIEISERFNFRHEITPFVYSGSVYGKFLRLIESNKVRNAHFVYNSKTGKSHRSDEEPESNQSAEVNNKTNAADSEVASTKDVLKIGAASLGALAVGAAATLLLTRGCQ